MISDAQWLALLLCTESNAPHEWPFVGWTVRRRVESDRIMFGGATYSGVILKRSQFSAFNGHVGAPEAIYAAVRGATNRRGERLYSDRQLDLAEHCAAWIIGTPQTGAPISATSFYYYSPVSMEPRGALPKWDWSRLRRYCWPNVDPDRFVAAEEIGS